MEDYKVLMRHDDVKATAEAWKSAYDVVWADLGWTIVDHAAEIASREFGTDVTDVSKLRKDQLTVIAPELGVTLTGDETKDDILSKFDVAEKES